MTDNTNPSLPPIYARPNDYVGKAPFEGDQFERQRLADKLTDYLDRLKDGCVIGIDAPWGDGKTWFARNWHAKLKTLGYKTIYLDAFERDYSDDPFMVISAEILTALKADEKSEPGKSLWNASKKLGKAILPTATQITINAIGRWALGTSNFHESIQKTLEQIEEKAADAAEQYIESRLKESEEEKRSVENFRNALKTFAAAQEKPVVFFIDELDRCRPTFAVQVIERIKHFFDVPNLIFVLMVNRGQLEKAINGVYGPVDARAYLGKFVHLFFTLPKSSLLMTGSHDYNFRYCFTVADSYRFNTQNKKPLNDFVQEFSKIVHAMPLSFRDIEKAFALLAMANADDRMVYYAWPIALKLKRPDIFTGLVRDEIPAHQEAIKYLQTLFSKEDGRYYHYGLYQVLHKLHASGIDALTDTERKELEITPFIRGSNPKEFLPNILRRLDIQVN
jgi:hypothetical protein